jgi:hypothetical protein
MRSLEAWEVRHLGNKTFFFEHAVTVLSKNNLCDQNLCLEALSYKQYPVSSMFASQAFSRKYSALLRPSITYSFHHGI